MNRLDANVVHHELLEKAGLDCSLGFYSFLVYGQENLSKNSHQIKLKEMLNL